MHSHPGFAQYFRVLLAILIAALKMPHLVCSFADVYKRQGIIYISHKMDEIFKICDEITILRDGKWINTVQVKGTTMEEIVSMMVGRELT